MGCSFIAFCNGIVSIHTYVRIEIAPVDDGVAIYVVSIHTYVRIEMGQHREITL